MNFPYPNRTLYVPLSLSEIKDLLATMVLEAPTFVDRIGYFPDQNTDSRFRQLTQGLDRTRKKLGEERYTTLVDLAARAKALFAADQGDTNGKTDEGRKLLFEIEDLIQAARRRRVKEKLPDEDGEVTGD